METIIQILKQLESKGYECWNDHYVWKCDVKTIGDEIAIELALIQKWLREEKKILVYCIPFFDLNRWHVKVVRITDETNYAQGSNIATYEEALIEGIQAALKLI